MQDISRKIFPEAERAKLQTGIARRVFYLIWLNMALSIYFLPAALILFFMNRDQYLGERRLPYLRQSL